MIVETTPRVPHLLQEVWRPLVLLFLWDVAVTVAYYRLPFHAPSLPLPLFGTVLALLDCFLVCLKKGTIQVKTATGALGSLVLLLVFGCPWYDHVATAFCWFAAAVWLSTTSRSLSTNNRRQIQQAVAA